MGSSHLSVSVDCGLSRTGDVHNIGTEEEGASLPPLPSKN